MVGDRRHISRVERQHRLQPQQTVEKEKGHRAESDDRESISCPTLLACRINAAEPVEHPLDRLEESVAGRGVGLAVHARDVEAQRRCGDRE